MGPFWFEKGRKALLFSQQGTRKSGIGMSLYETLRSERSFFHVHTYRCGHAASCEDEAYVRAALYQGAKHLYFTDHSPFPGNPFGSRMAYEDLEEYLFSLGELKKRYASRICIHIGLEIEYFPSWHGYYGELLAREGLELLLLGQHFAEVSPGRYSFDLSREKQSKLLHRLVAENIALGAGSGFFAAVAHPDRLFWLHQDWTRSCGEAARIIVEAALARDLPLERNLSSLRDGLYREPFWELVPAGAKTIIGVDAHAPAQIMQAGSLLRREEGVWRFDCREGLEKEGEG